MFTKWPGRSHGAKGDINIKQIRTAVGEWPWRQHGACLVRVGLGNVPAVGGSAGHGLYKRDQAVSAYALTFSIGSVASRRVL